jgi:hypothetical protein
MLLLSFQVTRDLQERTQRWRQIEILAGVSIVVNPGLEAVKLLVRHVGRGHDAAATSASGGVPHVASRSRLSRHASHEDVRDHDNDSDAHSVAASNRSTASSHHKRHNLVRSGAVLFYIPTIENCTAMAIKIKGKLQFSCNIH